MSRSRSATRERQLAPRNFDRRVKGRDFFPQRANHRQRNARDYRRDLREVDESRVKCQDVAFDFAYSRLTSSTSADLSVHKLETARVRPRHGQVCGKISVITQITRNRALSRIGLFRNTMSLVDVRLLCFCMTCLVVGNEENATENRRVVQSRSTPVAI